MAMRQLDLFGRKIPLRYRVRLWIDSNRRLLTLVGALIVFVTFVVKEGMNEHLKSVVDSLDLANQIFAIRGDNTLTQSRLNEIQSRVDDIQAIAHRSDTSRIVSPQFINLARLVRDSEETAKAAIEQTESSSENTASLLASIPYSKGIRDTRELLEMQNDNLATESHNLETELGEGTFNIYMDNLWPNKPDKVRAAAKESDTLKRDSITLTANALSLQDSAQELRKRALEESESYRQKLETRYRYVTYLSYLLYTLGWTLGFAGRLFGVDELVGGED